MTAYYYNFSDLLLVIVVNVLLIYKLNIIVGIYGENIFRVVSGIH
jgi:hypothetical protein